VAPRSGAGRGARPLADPAGRALIGRMLETLRPYPEARTALARLLQERQEKSS
jgi:hypothetical protein